MARKGKIRTARKEKSSDTAKASPHTQGDKVLTALSLFSVDRPQWTVEDVATELGVSVATSYRYFRSLTKAGLICPVSRAHYALGPAIIEMDRQIQICDPLLNAARSVMQYLIGFAPEGSSILLCRAYRDRVMCVQQVIGTGPQLPLQYERGRVMPPFRTAVSKAILANLPTRLLKRIFEEDAKEISEVGLGENWEEFRDRLAEIRKDGYCVTTGDIDASRIGVAAPIFSRDRAILGSIGFITSAERGHDLIPLRLTRMTLLAARDIEQAIWSETEPTQAPSGRRRAAS